MQIYGNEIKFVFKDEIKFKSTEHSYASSEEIAATMSEIAKGASDQAISVNDGMNYMAVLLL